jgi:RNA polymerase sigma factor, sigma-70 family
MFLILLLDEDQNIIAAIYEKNQRIMLYTASQILGEDDGEEALHDAFVYLLERYKGRIAELRNKPKVYFVLVVKSLSISVARKNKTITLELDDEIFSTQESLEQEFLIKEAEEQLVKLIQSLNPVMSEILEYKYIMDYSNKEIADLLEISMSAVSSRIDRAKKALKEKLEERMEGESNDRCSI